MPLPPGSAGWTKAAGAAAEGAAKDSKSGGGDGGTGGAGGRAACPPPPLWSAESVLKVARSTATLLDLVLQKGTESYASPSLRPSVPPSLSLARSYARRLHLSRALPFVPQAAAQGKITLEMEQKICHDRQKKGGNNIIIVIYTKDRQ